jgi:hypothetical protein
MKNNTLIISLITVPVIAGAFLSTAVLSQVSADDCNAQIDLQGSVTRNQASVTNHSTNSACSYDATLAVYDSPQEPETNGWINAQTLIGSKSVNVKPGETVSLTVDGTGSSCWNQADLIRGTEVLTPPVYRDAMDTDVFKVNENNCKTAVGGASATQSTTQLASTGDSIFTYAVMLAGVVTLLAGMLLKKKANNA